MGYWVVWLEALLPRWWNTHPAHWDQWHERKLDFGLAGKSCQTVRRSHQLPLQESTSRVRKRAVYTVLSLRQERGSWGLYSWTGNEPAHYPCAFEKVTCPPGLSSLVHTHIRTIVAFPCHDLLKAKEDKQWKNQCHRVKAWKEKQVNHLHWYTSEAEFWRVRAIC